MDIAFITPEITPYSRATELGDVCAALPKALRGTGHRVTVISPLWSDVDPGGRSLARRLTAIETKLLVDAPGAAHVVFDGRTTGGVDLVFLAQAERFGGVASAAFAALGARERMLAALDFSIAAVELLCQRDPKPEIVHAHGYFAAAALPLVREKLPNAATVLSVHDLGERGALDTSMLSNVRLPDAVAEAAGARPSLLRAGIRAAQRVITSSAADARALAAEQPELDGKLLAIAHGADSSRINPASDALIPARFDAVELGGKQRCKDALQYAAGLPLRADVPLFVVAGDLRDGAALATTLAGVLRNDVQVVIFGADAAAGGALADLCAQYGERLKLLEGSGPSAPSGGDERALHAAIAGADFALLPSRTVALGDLHLWALRYGALPVAMQDERSADTLVDCDAALESGNAFLSSAGELAATAQRATAAFANGAAFEKLRRRVMRTDVSWERAARRYEHAYKTLKL
jgi:starch synthase